MTKFFVLLVAVTAVFLHPQSTLAQAPLKFPSPGVLLPGSQLHYDSDFEVMDWNDDGKPDIFLYATGLVTGAVHLNEGTLEEPRLGHAIGYPYNTTETEPQTIEHVVAYTTCDLNHDGLFDFIWFDGQMRYCPNTNTKHGPYHWDIYKNGNRSDGTLNLFPGTEKFQQENSRIVTGPESMYWNKGIFPRQVITFTAADWDGDGLQDLLVCRFKDQAPGVTPGSPSEGWTPWGRVGYRPAPQAPTPTEDYTKPLKAAPERGFYFYKNLGTKDKPNFDTGVEITTPDGKAIAAPNPVVFDVDGDGVLDVVSSEAPYRSNAFRVDWPTAPNVQWFKRATVRDVDKLATAQPLLAGGKPVPAGVKARFADFRKRGASDLLVMNPNLAGSLRWYKNTAANAKAKPGFQAATELRGPDFNRFEFMAQPVIVDWFGKGSRDLILFGDVDAHCKFALRRMALYRNVAKKPSEVAYDFVGWFNYNGDPAMIPVKYEERPYEAYGNALSFMPDENATGNARKRFLATIGGKFFFFSDLDKDGLTFHKMTKLDIPNNSNRHKGWQEIDVNVNEPVKYIRLGNDTNGMGNLRDSFLNVVNFEALSGGKNVATLENGVTAKTTNDYQDSQWYRVQEPQLMFTPGNQVSDAKPSFSSWGYYMGPAVITLKEPVKLDKIRFNFADRELMSYDKFTPFAWQGKSYHIGTEAGEPWYQYKLEVSPDGKTWTTVADRMETEMLYSHPVLVDWDKDGKCDLLLAITSGHGIWPSKTSYRLYLNKGTNDEPKYSDYLPIADETGKPLSLQANWSNTYGAQCGVQVKDLNKDGKLDLITETASGFNYYENAGATATDLKFKNLNELGNGYTPIHFASRYRYFDLADADGDGTLDLICNDGGVMTFFKGDTSDAPQVLPLPESYKVTKIDAKGVEFSWPKIANAASYDLRWSEGEEITELNWNRLPSIKGTYSADREGGPVNTQFATVTGLPAGKVVKVAFKSLDAKGHASGISSLGEVALPALKRVVLRNGPEAGVDFPSYSGNQAQTLDANKPTEVVPPSPSFEVRSQMPPGGGAKQRVALVRFTNLPKVPVEKATLDLQPDRTVLGDMTLFDPVVVAMTCQSFRDDWDPAAATWSQAKAGAPFAERELDTAGTFQSFLKPIFLVQQEPHCTFDVTQALRQAQREGKDSVTFLLRVDWTGHYAAGIGYKFYGPEAPQVETRPRLELITRG